MSLKVAVNGFGTIGKRVADAVARQGDMTLVGVAKTTPNFEAEFAVMRGYPLYVAGKGKLEEFRAAQLPVAGAADEMIRKADIVVDASPESVGAENRRMYDAAGVRSIFQGGEKAEVAEASFSALANYDAAKGKRRVRVVSCNTTGLSRAASVLLPQFGVESWEATIIRRAADPAESSRGPINGILPTFKLPSHHGPDVTTIYPDLRIVTTAVVVPTTLMHLHVNHVKLRNPPKHASDVVAAFRASPRFRVFSAWEKVDGTPQVMEYARDRGGERADMMENVIWENGLHLEGADLHFFQGIHQESIVIPENIDALRSMAGLADMATSVRMTDLSLKIPHPS
jgi:glyceraldehyde-3-phosphate dehydrogenase (NAD(P))